MQWQKRLRGNKGYKCFQSEKKSCFFITKRERERDFYFSLPLLLMYTYCGKLAQEKTKML